MAGLVDTVARVTTQVGLAGGQWDGELERLVSPVPLQQTWAWGEVQARLGARTEHVELPSGGRALVLLRGAGPFAWAHAPRGPVPATVEAVSELADWARSRHLALLRVEPEGPASLGEALSRMGLRPGPISEPKHTVIVELHDDQELLAKYRKSTRYNLRTAERLGVLVDEVDDIEELSRLVEITYRRQGILMSTAVFNRALHEVLPESRIYVARVDADPLAAILVGRHGSRAHYLAGGSSGLHRELMPNYSLQWRAMRDAYRDGCVDYDLWGIPPPGELNHPWQGLYQFKTGFGGREVEYAGPWDLVLSPGADAIMRHTHWLATRARRLVHRGSRLLHRETSP
jgi:hypothetical protein